MMSFEVKGATCLSLKRICHRSMMRRFNSSSRNVRDIYARTPRWDRGSSSEMSNGRDARCGVDICRICPQHGCIPDRKARPNTCDLRHSRPLVSYTQITLSTSNPFFASFSFIHGSTYPRWLATTWIPLSRNSVVK